MEVRQKNKLSLKKGRNSLLFLKSKFFELAFDTTFIGVREEKMRRIRNPSSVFVVTSSILLVV